MLFTSFMTLLVFSTFSNSITINRMGMICLIYSTILLTTSFDFNACIPGFTITNNWFVITNNNMLMLFMILFVTMLMLLYSTSTTKYDLKSPYLFLMMLGNIMGLTLLPLVNDLMVLYMVMELQSYTLYLLTGLHNRSYNASRASTLYFLMGGIASTIILLSSYYIYGLTGSTNLSDMNMYNELVTNNINNNYYNVNDYFNMLIMALLFKMGLAPLHRWSMGVYNYAPTYMTAYMSMVAKLSIMMFMFNNIQLFNNYVLMMFFYISLVMGSYKPLFQMNMKNMLAYSGMLNFGYMLLTLMTSDNMMYLYLMQYSMTHVLLFLMMLAAGQYVNNPVSVWSPLMYMQQLKLPNLSLAMCMVLALFSLMGMPPLPGFYGKYYMLMSTLYDNYMFETCFLIMCSVMGTYY
uniref:NADH-ubiquinone oxidoreductase chain 2 n=1 Tax=Pichia sorbitophila (strain ATCC MYA-4447 / BCRC 22081 / CBS 7064 / NBRC 10061 / NRRL Y-12695) TaxID=559304 RepID=C7U013_PICSO|nr:NADH dehydrogenase subunit 2 [Millerozyma farinosa]CAY39294.1 NADH dehydrogenase, subunit 2 [Millerozyma farinosa]